MQLFRDKPPLPSCLNFIILYLNYWLLFVSSNYACMCTCLVVVMSGSPSRKQHFKKLMSFPVPIRDTFPSQRDGTSLPQSPSPLWNCFSRLLTCSFLIYMLYIFYDINSEFFFYEFLHVCSWVLKCQFLWLNSPVILYFLPALIVCLPHDAFYRWNFPLRFF